MSLAGGSVGVDLSTSLAGVYRVCISQENSKEKNVQVRMMGAIYQQALRVLIWLGKDDDGNALMGLESAWQLSKLEENSVWSLSRRLELQINFK